MIGYSKVYIPWWLNLGEAVSGTEGRQQKEVKSKCVCLRLSKVFMRWFKGCGVCSGISCIPRKTPRLNLTGGSQDHTRNSHKESGHCLVLD